MLRPQAISPTYRGKGIAVQLVSFIENFGLTNGVDALFLLTTTVSDFFEKLGFKPSSRSMAPTTIQGTVQFLGICPALSSFLSKVIGIR